MRKILMGSVLALIVVPAWAQSLEEIKTKCASDNPNVSIRGCTAYIKSGDNDAHLLATAHYNRGYDYVKKGLYDKAILDLTAAIPILTDRSNIYYNTNDAFKTYYYRAIAYEKKHQRDNAVADYRAALAFDPDNDYAKKGLARLSATP